MSAAPFFVARDVRRAQRMKRAIDLARPTLRNK
jgi:hypothetical protein